MTVLDRRKFLYISLLGLFSASRFSAWGLPNTTKYGILFAPHCLEPKSAKSKICGIAIFDIDEQTLTSIPSSFDGHQVSLFGTRHFLMAERLGPRLAKFSIDQKKQISTLDLSAKGMSFYGHFLISKDKGSIFATAFDEKNQYLLVLDAESLKVKSQTHLASEISHACGFLDDHHMFILCKTNVDLINLNTFKRETCLFHEEGRIFNHFTQMSDGQLIVASYLDNKPTRKSLKDAKVDGKLHLLDKTSGKWSELETKNFQNFGADRFFGMAVNKDNSLLGIAAPWDDQVTFWNLTSRKLVQVHTKSWPTGVELSPDGKSFLVLGNDGISIYDANSGRLIEEKRMATDVKKLFGGSVETRQVGHDTVDRSFAHSSLLIRA